MSRIASIILLLVAVLCVTLGTYFIVFPRAQEINREEAQNGLVAAGRLLQEKAVTDEGRLLWKLTELASRNSVKNLLREKPTESAKAASWLNKLRSEIAGLATAAREISPVKDFFVLNPRGVGLARNIDLHWTGKTPSNHQKVKEAIRRAGEGRQDMLIIEEGGVLLRAVVVPVVVGGQVLAILYANFPVDDTLAKAQSTELNLDLEFAYVTQKGVVAGALSENGRKTVEDFIKSSGVQIGSLVGGKPLQPRIANHLSSQWLLAGFPVTARGGKGLCGLILLRNLDSIKKPFGELTLWLFGVAGIGFLVLMILTIILGGRVFSGLKQLEKDALEMATGDTSRRFKVQGPSSIRALAELLNQLQAGGIPAEAPAPEEEEPPEDQAEADEAPAEEETPEGTEEEEEPEPLDEAEAPEVLEEEEPDRPELEDLPEEAQEEAQEETPEEEEPGLPEEEAQAAPEEQESLDASPEDMEASPEDTEAPPEPEDEAPEEQAQEPAESEEPEEPGEEAAQDLEEDASLEEAARAMAEQEQEQEPEQEALSDEEAPGAPDQEPQEAEQEQAPEEFEAGDIQQAHEEEDIEAATEVVDPERAKEMMETLMGVDKDTEESTMEDQAVQAESSPPVADDQPPAAEEPPKPAPKPRKAGGKKDVLDDEYRYYRDVYHDFVKAKEQLGESVDKLNFERFVRKLKKQEGLLRTKHKCKAVKFQVMVKNNQVSLRPRIIR